MYSSVALCSRGEDFGPLRGQRPCFPSRTLSNKMSPAQRDHHARATERKAKAALRAIFGATPAGHPLTTHVQSIRKQPDYFRIADIPPRIKRRLILSR